MDGIKSIVIAAGGYRKVADECGISPSAVHMWVKVPCSRVLEISRLSGISVFDIRPDIYGKNLSEFLPLAVGRMSDK